MRLIVTLFVLLLAGCSATSKAPNTADASLSDTMEIIRSAAAAAPQGVTGDYVLFVKATGSQGPAVYLNTEMDYRDQRSVTIALDPSVVGELTEQYGQAPQDFFLNKSIAVAGEAKRAKIYFYSRGKRTNKYYFQTHIRVLNAKQIKVVD